MKKKLIISMMVLAMFLLFVSCDNNKITSDGQKEVYYNSTADSDGVAKAPEIDFIKDTLEIKREIEIIDDSIYMLEDNYGADTNIAEIINGSDEIGFYLEKANIYDFMVSSDNKYVAVKTFDQENVKNQDITIYDHEKNELYSISYSDIIKDDSKEDLLYFVGFSEKNKYFYGMIGGMLDVSGYYAVDIETGEIQVFENDNIGDYNSLREEYPISH